MPEIEVAAEAGAYPVVVEVGLAETMEQRLPGAGEDARMLVIADQNTAPLLGARLAGALGAALFEVAAGEKSKSFAEVERACTVAAEAGLDRGSTVVAVGGGVVGDLAGMVAAVFMRGVALVHVPTTLLAMVDSSIGGKTGVNLPAGKNLVGAFKPPKAVLIDPGLLASLSEREYRSGLAEVVKYSMIADEQLYDSLLANGQKVLARDPELMAEIISTCCAIKAGVVSRDEREAGERAILNYGHTVGHALEAATEYGRYTHGEAISVGMSVAAGIGVTTGVTAPDVAYRQTDLLESFGLPDRAPGATGVEDLVRAMGHDKKSRSGETRWVLLEELGHASPGHTVPDEIARGAIRAALAQ